MNIVTTMEGSGVPGVHRVDRRFAQSPVSSDDVRESMCRLPRAFAAPLTMLTGKPHSGQPVIWFTPTRHLMNACFSLLAGVTISVTALTMSGWGLLLLLFGWAMTLHGIRNLRMMIYHQCAHRNMWGNRRIDTALGKCIAAVLIVQRFERYSADHISDHHALNHMTLRDPTVQAFLVGLRLRPEMSRSAMWWRVLGHLVSPVFHARFLVARVRSYLHSASHAERAASLTVALAMLGFVYWRDGWIELLVVWLLPLTVFFQISNTLRLCVKHTFPDPSQETRRGRDYFAGLTNAIFIGERAPAPGLPYLERVREWTRWWLRILLVHFPARYLVLSGDTVCHDFHHRHPMSKDWANYIFARERDAEDHPGWPPYRHVWGLVPAINTVFESLSAADPMVYSPERLAEVNRREMFAAFDD